MVSTTFSLSLPRRLGPKPETITGGCLCGALRYAITFPESHDFASDAKTCQCTQCRKQSGALFVAFHRAPWPFRWSDDATATAGNGTRNNTLKEFSITPVAKRGFCTECSSWLYYRAEGEPWASLCVGTVDQEVLIGAPGDGGRHKNTRPMGTHRYPKIWVRLFSNL
ncbi:hypothetical protein CTA1_487 [Colletotrichum tanaceti]|uniref:CENP-V/GFA domain-containing protein n=1 Tax=Colletotrichum tanaceti TaxID=1306861 RepID=A0A4U6XHW1_9PEZI|nr:hypothetical protein CTA1_487 [Colletotrichum tanaceti]